MLDIAYDPPSRTNEKPLKWIIVDSLIIACIAFLASLPGGRPPSAEELYVALKTFAYAFLAQLAIERGLKPYVERASKKRGSNG